MDNNVDVGSSVERANVFTSALKEERVRFLGRIKIILVCASIALVIPRVIADRGFSAHWFQFVWGSLQIIGLAFVVMAIIELLRPQGWLYLRQRVSTKSISSFQTYPEVSVFCVRDLFREQDAAAVKHKLGKI